MCHLMFSGRKDVADADPRPQCPLCSRYLGLVCESLSSSTNRLNVWCLSGEEELRTHREAEAVGATTHPAEVRIHALHPGGGDGPTRPTAASVSIAQPSPILS